MADPYLLIESEGGTIQSNEFASTGTGVEVQPGVTGLGLPGVSLQFDEGAGDGATYRGRRVLQRNLDVRFHITGPDRASLREHADRVAQVLAYPCTITWVDDDAGESWRIVGHRSGGGDYAYGIDPDEDGTDGTTWLDITVTFQTESPYWESDSPQTASVRSTGRLVMTNEGNVDTYPVWTINGPSLGARFVAPDGRSFWFTGLIDAGQSVTVDTGKGTVTDNFGRSRYADLAPLPNFFSLDPGPQVVDVLLDQLSDKYEQAFSAPRYNFVRNPKFAVDAATWTVNGFDYDAANDRMVMGTALIEQANGRPYLRTTCSGLTVGQTYVVWVEGENTPAAYGANAERRGAQLAIGDGSVLKQMFYDLKKPLVDQPFTFVAENTSVDLAIIPEAALGGAGRWQPSSGYVKRVFLGTPGLPYFDGDSADDGLLDYVWTGTPNASTSTAIPPSLPPSGLSSVDVEWRTRRWLVI